MKTKEQIHPSDLLSIDPVFPSMEVVESHKYCFYPFIYNLMFKPEVSTGV